MSIRTLENAPWLNIVCNSVTADEHFTGNLIVDNLQVMNGAELNNNTLIKDDLIIKNGFQVGSSSQGATGYYTFPETTGQVNQVLGLMNNTNTLTWMNVGKGSTNISATGENVIVTDQGKIGRAHV